ncbi:hypothetical protein [Rhodoferax sp.]|uniref:hypothetical protein n=1 Tax=Rhodoferax sp. TaxID=50421 RepID=UPI002ACEDA7B|nr:hypothetical protein [Rhodoferax sp.]MDZ7920719.1 hypothetical protein [Rhodoferax sp.]
MSDTKDMPAASPTLPETSVSQPSRINLFALPHYIPEKQQSTRPGADDHRKVQSRGYRT